MQMLPRQRLSALNQALFAKILCEQRTVMNDLFSQGGHSLDIRRESWLPRFLDNLSSDERGGGERSELDRFVDDFFYTASPAVFRDLSLSRFVVLERAHEAFNEYRDALAQALAQLFRSAGAKRLFVAPYSREPWSCFSKDRGQIATFSLFHYLEQNGVDLSSNDVLLIEDEEFEGFLAQLFNFNAGGYLNADFFVGVCELPLCVYYGKHGDIFFSYLPSYQETVERLIEESALKISEAPYGGETFSNKNGTLASFSASECAFAIEHVTRSNAIFLAEELLRKSAEDYRGSATELLKRHVYYFISGDDFDFHAHLDRVIELCFAPQMLNDPAWGAELYQLFLDRIEYLLENRLGSPAGFANEPLKKSKLIIDCVESFFRLTAHLSIIPAALLKQALELLSAYPLSAADPPYYRKEYLHFDQFLSEAQEELSTSVTGDAIYPLLVERLLKEINRRGTEGSRGSSPDAVSSSTFYSGAASSSAVSASAVSASVVTYTSLDAAPAGSASSYVAGERHEHQIAGVRFYERVIPPVRGRGGPFLLMETPVTQELYEVVMGTNPSHFRGSLRPVEMLSWFDGVTFANALSEKLGLSAAYDVPAPGPLCGASLVRANGFRLPFEEEWEWAAKGGEAHAYAGSDTPAFVGWYGAFDGSGNLPEGAGTRPVQQLRANKYGLFDMSGNVWEWCADDYERPGHAPRTAQFRARRGGSWRDEANACRVSYRLRFSPKLCSNSLGLRLLRPLN